MHFETLSIPGPVLIKPKKIGDARGYFVETFRADLFAREIGPHDFVQDNQSLSAAAGTVRGLHFQIPPRAQGKLVRCLQGAILDVAVDLRPDSEHYGRHIAIELRESDGWQLWIPIGFAHGFCTLHTDSVIAYKCTDYYSPAHDRGLLWCDPDLGISWPVDRESAILSAKDSAQPRLVDLKAGFGEEG